MTDLQSRPIAIIIFIRHLRKIKIKIQIFVSKNVFYWCNCRDGCGDHWWLLFWFIFTALVSTCLALFFVYPFTRSALKNHDSCSDLWMFFLCLYFRDESPLVFWSTWPTHSHGRKWSLFCICSSVRTFQNKTNFKRKQCSLLGLAEWIIDDTSCLLISYFSSLFSFQKLLFPPSH